MQNLLVFQSLWAMERRHTDGYERSIEENLKMIERAGFDGVSYSYEDRKLVKEVSSFLTDNKMSAEAMCYPRSIDDLKPVLDNAAEFGARHITLQADIRPYTLKECIPILEGWKHLEEEYNIPVYIETHRNRMTTDLYFTLRLLEAFPSLKFTADLSHYLVGREFMWPVSEEDHSYIYKILDNSFSFHGRVASREQVQVEISFAHHKKWVDLFMMWWSYGFKSWKSRADKNNSLIFTCEIGPNPYAITGSDGNDLTDRWNESLIMKDMVKNIWDNLD